MKTSRLFVIFVSLAACAFFFTSCTIVKRHYRNGYYVQHSTGLVNRKCVQNNPADAENYIEVMRASINSERADSIGVTSNADCRENNVADFTAFACTVNEGSEQKNVVIENKICSENKGQTAAIAKVNDEPEEKDDKRKPGKVLTILGAILVFTGLIGKVMTGAIVAGIVLVPLGVLFLCLGLIKKQRSKTRSQKKKLYNTKQLWISALIFLGIFILFIIPAAAISETWFIGSLIALTIALILVIAASIGDRRKKKANQDVNDQEKGKKGIRILKKILKWTLIILGALTLIGLIGFLGSVAS